jgi:hypothetical protein
MVESHIVRSFSQGPGKFIRGLLLARIEMHFPLRDDRNLLSLLQELHFLSGLGT